jgi:hypothetical protein
MPFWNTTSTTLENAQMVVNNTYKDANGNNKLTTITTTNPTGFVPIDKNSTDPILKNLSYVVQTDGKIRYQLEGSGSFNQFESIQQIANSGINGYDDNTTKRIKDSMQKNLAAQTNDYNTKNPTTKLGPAAGPPPTEGDPKNATQTQFQTIAETAAKSYKGRKEYEKDLRYPENMNKNQDCIQFKIIEYIPSKLGLSGSEDIKLRTTFGTRSPLSTITLPMPSGGISDRNSVNWGSSELDVAQDAFANVAMNAILGGVGAGADAAKKELTKATAGNKDLLAAIMAAKGSERAVGANNLLSRAFGVELNPNLELLFNSPELREFSFSFKMTPRSKGEAQIVRSIIRTFKQAMSVKRSESVLLLKSPHTFRISYLTSTKDHPYLNRFKECALTNCSVNYTPDGSYMSYDDSSPNGRSMTAYELSLSFSELEPIFDDDYENMEDAKGKESFNHIGY